MLRYIKETLDRFLQDECPTLAAALAYYTVFSLPSLLLIVVSVAGLILGRDTVQSAIQQKVQAMMGGDTFGQIGTIVTGAKQKTSGVGALGVVVSVMGILVAATSAFMQLQFSLNRAWKVRCESFGLRGFLGKRISSFGMLIAFSMLIVGTMVVSSWVAGVGQALPVPVYAAQALAVTISVVFMSLLFAAVFKYVPDAEIEWKDVRFGAFVTAILFEVGQFLLSVYLAKVGLASVYGAAGSLALILLFVYYFSMLLLFGAEFTHVLAKGRGVPIRPARGATIVPEAA